MKHYVCKFVGGKLDGQVIAREVAMECCSVSGFTEDMSEWRDHGAVVQESDLDNQPIFDGYFGPMIDGTLNLFGEPFVVLRYETQEVYDLLSD